MDEGFLRCECASQLWFCQNTRAQKTPAALLDHDEPHRGEAFMWLHISIWLLMGAHRPRKASGLWISWLPTFSSKWLIRGGYAERTVKTAVGVWLSSETLVGDCACHGYITKYNPAWLLSVTEKDLSACYYKFFSLSPTILSPKQN